MTTDWETSERERARAVVLQARERARSRDDSFLALRRTNAQHALAVLVSDHRAYMAAIGKADVELDVAFSDADPRRTDTRLWHAMNKAYTNFDKILVRVAVPHLRTSLREFVISVRGTLHHESGHIRFTIPLPELWARGSAAWQHRPGGTVSVKQLQTVWNCLEDQRMEAAVVRATPRIATYFVPMVLGYVTADVERQGYMSGAQVTAIEALAPWLAMAGRDYLPNAVRVEARQAFDEYAQQFDIASDDWFDVVARYMGASEEPDMVEALLDAHDLLERLLQGIADDADSGQQHLKTMSMMQTKEALAKKLNNSGEQHQQMTESNGVDAREGATHPRPPQDQREEDDPGRDRYARANADIDDVMSRIGERTAASSLSNSLEVTSQPMYSRERSEAEVLSYAIRDALEKFRTQKLPVWLRHQEHGYLDAVAYRTREPGERTYHREPRNYANRGLGLHVSFLADRSGSMWSGMMALSQTMWAVKTACDALDIPNTMVLWSDGRRTTRVMEHDDIPRVYDTGGGTDPTAALDDLDHHVRDEGLHHLVFMFTDGDWSSPESLTEWHRDDRTFVVIGLDCVDSIVNKDAQVVIPIRAIGELGAVVMHVLEDYLEVL